MNQVDQHPRSIPFTGQITSQWRFWDYVNNRPFRYGLNREKIYYHEKRELRKESEST